MNLDLFIFSNFSRIPFLIIGVKQQKNNKYEIFASFMSRVQNILKVPLTFFK